MIGTVGVLGFFWGPLRGFDDSTFYHFIPSRFFCYSVAGSQYSRSMGLFQSVWAFAGMEGA